MPIIVLSAKADTHDIVAALEAGADDYVTKPFEIKEVSARLRALRRRPPVRPPAQVEAAPHETPTAGSRQPRMARWSWTPQPGSCAAVRIRCT